MSDRPFVGAIKPQRHEIEAYLESQRRQVESRTTGEMIQCVLIELNRQLDPLLKSSQLRVLDQDDLDRMIGINTAVLAIHRSLAIPIDPTEASEDELRRAARR